MTAKRRRRAALPLREAVVPVPTPHMTEAEAAAYLKRARVTLKNLRLSGKGPQYFQPVPDGKITYRIEDLDAWVAGGLRSSTTDPPVMEAS